MFNFMYQNVRIILNNKIEETVQLYPKNEFHIFWFYCIRKPQYSKSPHITTYQNKSLDAVFPKSCTLQLRTCFSLMKHRFLLQG